MGHIHINIWPKIRVWIGASGLQFLLNTWVATLVSYTKIVYCGVLYHFLKFITLVLKHPFYRCTHSLITRWIFILMCKQEVFIVWHFPIIQYSIKYNTFFPDSNCKRNFYIHHSFFNGLLSIHSATFRQIFFNYLINN